MVPLAALALACSGEGSIDIELLWPDEALAPDTSEVFEITLVRNAAGEPSTRTVHRAPEPDGEISLGRVAAGDDVRLAVELRSPTQRLVGYGRSQASRDVAPGDSLDLSMHVRKPFLYLTGDAVEDPLADPPVDIAIPITTLDPTIDGPGVGPGDSPTGGNYLGRIDVLTEPLAAATSSDGRALYVVHGAPGAYQLTVLATANHAEPLFAPVELEQPPTEIAVSADGRYVAIGHADGLSVVDTSRAGEELGAVTPAAISGPVARVAVSPGARPTAYALLGGRQCGDPAARIVAFDLDDPQTVLAELTLPGPAADVAALGGPGDSDSGSDGGGQPELLVARACEGDILAATMVAADAPQTAPFATVPGVSALAVLDDRIWAAGSIKQDDSEPLSDAYLIAVSFDPGGAEQSYAEMPVLQQRVRTDEYAVESEEAVRQMDAVQIAAVHMGVVPGGDAIALTVEAEYYGPAHWKEVFGSGIEVLALPETTARTVELLLLDVATSTPVRRLRTACELTVVAEEEALVGGWACGQSPDQDVVESDFTPTSLAILYGGS